MNDPILPDMPPPTLDQLAREQIRQWIASTGITQTEVAARIGRNQSWMSRYLNGEFDADLETLAKMAEVFGHTLPTLLGLPTSDPEERRILTLYRGLRVPMRKTVRAVLDELNVAARRPRRSRKPART